jgi:hypothetical protein
VTHPAGAPGGEQECGQGKRGEPERGRVGDAGGGNSVGWGRLDCAVFADAQKDPS